MTNAMPNSRCGAVRTKYLPLRSSEARYTPAQWRKKFQRSSVVERSAVNRLVVGSNPTAGANFNRLTTRRFSNREDRLAKCQQIACAHHVSHAGPAKHEEEPRNCNRRFLGNADMRVATVRSLAVYATRDDKQSLGHCAVSRNKRSAI